jgi:hypothetical protein
MTRPSYNGPTWSADYFALASMEGTGRFGDRPAVCRLHDPPHVVYAPPNGEPWCQEIPPHRAGRRVSRLRHEESTAPTVVVRLDEDRLGSVIADGVVDGFRRARAEQRAERRR